MKGGLEKARATLRHRYVVAYQRWFAEHVFIHVNKTGGTSIRKALGSHAEHRTAREKMADLGRERWDHLYSFAFVRNPWDRVVSHYHHRVETDQTGLGDGSVPFREWVRLAYRDQVAPYYDNPKMFQPQNDWITDADGTILVDFVGRYERLSEDFDVVCRRLGRRATLPHLKASRRGDYRRYYDEETRAIVASWFRKDIHTFGYEFGGGP